MNLPPGRKPAKDTARVFIIYEQVQAQEAAAAAMRRIRKQAMADGARADYSPQWNPNCAEVRSFWIERFTRFDHRFPIS